MAFQKGDFVTINYTGKLVDGTVFDTTVEAIARSAGLNSKATYGPVTVQIGERHAIPGIDDALVGKSVGTYTVVVPAEQGFGKKSAKLLKLVPMGQFKKQQIQPMPGLELNIDGEYGVIRSVSGGRVVVDFNHPLAGQELTYTLEIIKEVTDPKEKVQAVLTMNRISHENVELQGDHAIITMSRLAPQPILDALEKEIRKSGPKQVSFQNTAPPHEQKHDHTHEHPHEQPHDGHDHTGHKHE